MFKISNFRSWPRMSPRVTRLWHNRTENEAKGIKLNPSHYPWVRMQGAIWSLDKILLPFFILLQQPFTCQIDLIIEGIKRAQWLRTFRYFIIFKFFNESLKCNNPLYHVLSFIQLSRIFELHIINDRNVSLILLVDASVWINNFPTVMFDFIRI